MATSFGPLDLGEVYRRSCESITDEVEGLLEVVEGALPAGLRGVLFRNGPGRLEVHGQRYGHPFDGDGHLNRFAFTERGVVYRNRYVRTREFLEEEAARKILYRNFGTNIPGGFHKNLLRMRFKNAASCTRCGRAACPIASTRTPSTPSPATTSAARCATTVRSSSASSPPSCPTPPTRASTRTPATSSTSAPSRG